MGIFSVAIRSAQKYELMCGAQIVNKNHSISKDNNVTRKRERKNIWTDFRVEKLLLKSWPMFHMGQSRVLQCLLLDMLDAQKTIKNSMVMRCEVRVLWTKIIAFQKIIAHDLTLQQSHEEKREKEIWTDFHGEKLLLKSCSWPHIWSWQSKCTTLCSSHESLYLFLGCKRHALLCNPLYLLFSWDGHLWNEIYFGEILAGNFR